MSNENLDEFEAKLKEINKEPVVEQREPESEVEEEYENEELVTEAEVVKKQKPKDQTYSDVINQMPELKDDLDYLLIINKVKEGKDLTKKEISFKQVYEEAKTKEQEFVKANEIKAAEEAERQKDMQEKINQEYEAYKKLHPEGIEVYDNKTSTLKGSDNFLKVAKIWMRLIKTHKKGGKIFIKVTRSKTVSIEWTNKNTRYMEFWSKNERGDSVKEVTRVNEFKYTFEGTSIPVLFAIQGTAEAWDFYSEFRRDLSSEIVSGIVMEAYNTGFKDGLVLKDGSDKKNLLLELMPILMLVSLIIMGIVAYLCYSIYQDNTQILNTLAVIQQQASVVAIQNVTPLIVS